VEAEPATGFTRTVVRGAGVAGAGFGLTQVLSLGFALVLARVAAPRDFGEFAAGSILVGIGVLFSESGMLAAVIQRRDRLEEAANTALVSTMLAGVGLGLLALALSPLIGVIFDSERIGFVAAALSGVVLLSSMQVVPNALMQRRFAFVRRVVIDPLGIIAFGVTATVACASGLAVWGLVLGSYAALLVQAVSCWSFARWRPSPRLASFAMWRELNVFSKFVVGSELVVRARVILETVLLGRFVGTSGLGQYTYAMRIAGQPLWALVSAASYVLYPAFARIAPNESRFQLAFVRTLRWVALISLPLSLVLFPLGLPLTVLLLGETWRPAGEAVMGLCFFAAGQSLAGIAGEAFKATGRSDLLMKRDLVSLAATAALVSALLPFEIVGVAVAVSVSSVCVAAYALHRVSRILGLSPARLLAEVWPALLSALAMAVSLYPIDRLLLDASGREPALGLAILALEGLLAGLIYLGFLRLLAPDMANDLLSAAKTGWKRARRRHGRDSEPGAVGPTLSSNGV
jgi:O-antigen/teichoic acid export membrane protein